VPSSGRVRYPADMKLVGLAVMVAALGCRQEPRPRPAAAADAATDAVTAPRAGIDAAWVPGAAWVPDAAWALDAPAAVPDAGVAAASNRCKGGAMARTFDEGHSGKKVKVRLGATFAVELSAARHRSHWGTPALRGTSVEAAGREVKRPPDDVDGGANHYRFLFCAQKRGATRWTTRAGGDSPPADFTLTITVQ
jgi:hypothetical protein